MAVKITDLKDQLMKKINVEDVSQVEKVETIYRFGQVISKNKLDYFKRGRDGRHGKRRAAIHKGASSPR